MLTPNSEKKWKHWPPRKGADSPRSWAADSGRFSDPKSYADEKYLGWLSTFEPTQCLFATAPDVLGDHAATLAMSDPIMPLIRAFGFKVAFVAQDGFDTAPWDKFDCLFLGGTNAFKLGAAVPGIVSEARSRGKWVHMGRANSYKRLRVAAAIGCQSADGTFLRFGPRQNSVRLGRWLDKLHAQPLLPKGF
jgi:hypothetical protein